MIPTNDRGEHHYMIISYLIWCRMCIPVKYPIKSLVCQILRSQVERLGAAGKDPSPSSIIDLQKLLRMFEEIVDLEFYPDYDQLALESLADISCASCGGEIFLTLFSCGGTCVANSKTGKNGVIVCPLCFIDGRTCSCGEMRPLRVREMDPLVELRTEAQALIRGNAERLFLSESELNAVDVQSILTASLILYRVRSKKPVRWNHPSFGHELSLLSNGRLHKLVPTALVYPIRFPHLRC